MKVHHSNLKRFIKNYLKENSSLENKFNSYESCKEHILENKEFFTTGTSCTQLNWLAHILFQQTRNKRKLIFEIYMEKAIQKRSKYNKNVVSDTFL